MNKTISVVTDILFGLKQEMEQNSKVSFGMLGYYDEVKKLYCPHQQHFGLKMIIKEKKQQLIITKPFIHTPCPR